jgi:hypothetical protein
VLAPMIGLMKREARAVGFSRSPRNRQPSKEPAKARMEPFANDLREINHFSDSLKFFIVHTIYRSLAVLKRSKVSSSSTHPDQEMALPH